MKSTKFLIFITAMSVGSWGKAQESLDLVSTSSYMDKKIRKGDWSLGGNARFTYDENAGARTAASLEVEHFWLDGLSAGIRVRYEEVGSVSLRGLGLKSTYHFYESDKMTFFLSGEITSYELQGYSPINQPQWMATVGLGMNYFITPNIAFGPRIEWSESLSENRSGAGYARDQLNVLMGFSLFF